MSDAELDHRIRAVGELLDDLDEHIGRKAAELAAPAIAEAERAANEAIQEARLELQRERDLVAELRKRIDTRERQIERTGEARERLAAVLGLPLARQNLNVLVSDVERRLAEQDATIERLQREKLDAIQGHLVTEVPLPAMSGEGED